MAAMRTVWVECPECSEQIEVPIDVELVSPSGRSKSVVMKAIPDVSAVWMHAWTAHPETSA